MRGIKLPLTELGYGKGATARDIWSAKDLGRITADTHFTIPRHGVVMLKLTK